jgi:hypothetical protein
MFRVRGRDLQRKTAGIVRSMMATPLGGVHQVLFTRYNQTGTESAPGGRSCNSRHSASSPKAREGDPTARGRLEILNKSLMQEGGRIELRRVSARLTAYKAVSTPNGLRLPHERTGGPDQNRTGDLSATSRALFPSELQGHWLQTSLDFYSRALVTPGWFVNASVSVSVDESRMLSIHSRQRRSRGHFLV